MFETSATALRGTSGICGVTSGNLVMVYFYYVYNW